jgi:putative SOS response-associated peptidase YedK
MCARYTIKTTAKELAEFYNVKIPAGWDEQDWDDLVIVPNLSAPIILEERGEKQLKQSQFRFVPSWIGDVKDLKFATFNARLDSWDKATWRASFQKRRCLIPLTSFMEPIYVGKFAGHWVEFKPKESKYLTAAGIYNPWTNRKTGEIIHTYAMVTHDPLPFVEKTGHERSPLFLEEKAAEAWVDEAMDFEKLKKALDQIRAEPALAAIESDAMKPGWEKRIPKESKGAEARP